MTDEELQTLRAMLVETVGGAIDGMQRHLDDQILELQADVDSALEKLDSIEIDLRDVKLHVAKLSPETDQRSSA